MKNNELKTLRGMTDDELTAKTREAQAERFNLTLRKRMGQLEKPSRLRELKRQVARIETLRTERKNKATVSPAKK